MNGWVSPRLGIRFDTSGDELRIFGPDGTPFRSHQELEQLAAQAEQEREAERLARQQAEQEREAERLSRQQAEQQAAALAARLRELGIDPEALREGE
jgi:hypothetical protein